MGKNGGAMKQGTLFITLFAAAVLLIPLLIVDRSEPEIQPEPIPRWELEMEGMNNPFLSYENGQLCAEMNLPRPGLTRFIAAYCIDQNGIEFESGTFHARNDSVKYERYIQPVKDTVRAIAARRGWEVR